MTDEKDTGRRARPDVLGGDTPPTNEGAGILSAQDPEAAKAALTEQMGLLKEEVAELRETLGVLAESSGRYAVSQVNSLREDVRAAIAANPLSALVCAALFGYLLGLRRR